MMTFPRHLRGLAAAALLTACAASAAAAPSYPTGTVYRFTVAVDTNGVVTWPSNFWTIANASMITNWHVAFWSITNGAALGATALQPPATNGWTVGSHAGLATWPGATNAALAAWATAAETGTVSYAYAASRMSIAGDADYWMTVCDGTGTLWRVSIASGGVSNSSYIIVTGWHGEEGYTGPATNTVFNLVQVDGLQRLYSAPGYVLEIDDTPTRQRKLYTSTNLQDPIYLSESDAYTFPEQLAATDESGAWVVVDWAYFVTNSYALATLDNLAPLPTFADLNASNNADRAYADAAVVAAPEWIGITNLAAAVTVTNINERPIYLYSTGTVAVAFSGLRTPMPLYIVLRGPDSLTMPGAYFVGGGTFQTNMSNHYIVWKYGTNLFVNAVTATED